MPFSNFFGGIFFIKGLILEATQVEMAIWRERQWEHGGYARANLVAGNAGAESGGKTAGGGT